MLIRTILENDNGVKEESYTTSGQIKKSLLKYLENEIDKLNRRANKIGAEPIDLDVGEESIIEDDDGRQIKYVTVTVSGKPPQIEGYEFIATIDHKEGGNVIRFVPGKETVNAKEFYNARPEYCDHCKKRRRRIDTFIVKHKKSDKLRQIGRNCLADFLGGKDPKSVLFYTQWMGKVEEILKTANSYSGGMRGRETYYATTDTILLAAAALINEYGYRNSSWEAGDSTSYMVKKLYFFPIPQHKEWLKTYKEYKEVVKNGGKEAKEYKDKALKWFNSIPQDEKDNNNFYHNIDVILKGNHVTGRDVGYTVAIFPAYDKAMNIKKEYSRKSNEYLGQPGQKLPKTKITVVKTMLMNPFTYGAREPQLCKMEDDSGNSLTWFNSSANRLENGSQYYITGTIKKHDDYKGRKTTVLTRVKADKV